MATSKANLQKMYTIITGHLPEEDLLELCDDVLIYLMASHWSIR